jgi:hypothetical protein
LRSRCQHHAKALSTPMGDEMLFRYQQSLIDHTTVILKALVSRDTFSRNAMAPRESRPIM